MKTIKVRREYLENDAATFIERPHNTQLFNKFKRLPPIFNIQSIPFIIYSLLGIFLIVSFLIIFNVYFLHLKVTTSVVSVPMETMTAPASGLVKQLYVEAGSVVKKGDLLMQIENINLERDARLAHIQLADTQLTIAYLQSLLDNEKNKLNIYKSIGSNRVASTQAMVEESKQELVAAKKNLERFRTLLKMHYVTAADWDVAQTKYKNAEDKVKSAIANHNIESNSLKAVGDGLFFTGQKLEGVAGDLSAQIQAAQKRLELDQERVNVYESILSQLTLKAPYDGKVTQVLKSIGNTTDDVKPVLFIAKEGAKKTIIAYLTQTEISHVKAKGKVKIYIPALGEMYKGKIMSVDRTSGFLDEVNAQYRWRDLDVDRSATVVVEISGRDQKNFDKHVFAGMPAVIYFSRKFNLL